MGEVMLLFHRPSGQTHIVASPVPEILDALGEGAADAQAVMARLLRDHDLDDTPDARDVVHAHLDELDALGVIARA